LVRTSFFERFGLTGGRPIVLNRSPCRETNSPFRVRIAIHSTFTYAKVLPSFFVFVRNYYAH
jgi:hypothetical protein